MINGPLHALGVIPSSDVSFRQLTILQLEGFTYGSFVVTNNSSRGIPDALIASPTGFSVPVSQMYRMLVVVLAPELTPTVYPRSINMSVPSLQGGQDPRSRLGLFDRISARKNPQPLKQITSVSLNLPHWQMNSKFVPTTGTDAPVFSFIILVSHSDMVYNLTCVLCAGKRNPDPITTLLQW